MSLLFLPNEAERQAFACPDFFLKKIACNINAADI
jgi:hypothetical protein